jgi:DNA polymerase (family X)
MMPGVGDTGQGRPLLLDEAVAIAERVAERLRREPGCLEVCETGAVRRRAERPDAVELLVCGPASLFDLDWAHVADGATVIVHLTSPDRFGTDLARTTGPPAHAAAVARGAPAATEAELYGRLGLAVVPPELREDPLSLSGPLPDLVDVAAIRGDLHAHTTASDGTASIAEMAAAAMARGYGYLAITEHSPNVDRIVDRAIGLDPGRLREHAAAVREEARRLAPSGFTLLAGTEADILPDGSLDYDDDLLADLDWVVASPHTDLRQSPGEATARMVRAASHPLVDVIAHPTGRHLLERPPLAVDPAALAEACAAHGTFLEINANPERLDLSSVNARLAREAGVPIVISTDAHEIGHFANIAYGVATARRAGATAADIVNTRPWGELQALRKPVRQNGRGP